MKSQNNTDSIQNMDSGAIISYLEMRKWRSTLFLNLAIVTLGTLIAKVVTNFASGEPGLAGIRVEHGKFFMADG